MSCNHNKNHKGQSSHNTSVKALPCRGAGGGAQAPLATSVTTDRLSPTQQYFLLPTNPSARPGVSSPEQASGRAQAFSPTPQPRHRPASPPPGGSWVPSRLFSHSNQRCLTKHQLDHGISPLKTLAVLTALRRSQILAAPPCRCCSIHPC